MNLFQEFAALASKPSTDIPDDIFPELSALPLSRPQAPKPRVFRYPTQAEYNADIENILKAREGGPVSIEYGRNWSLEPVGQDEPITTIIQPGMRPEEEIAAGRIKPGEVFYQSGIGKLRDGGPMTVKRRLERNQVPEPDTYALADAMRETRMRR